MKWFEKNRNKVPGSERKKKDNTLLQTYLTSLASLMLCVTMFFGTTMAWFTSATESPLNQIYVGELSLTLSHASFRNGVLGEFEAVDPTHKILSPEIVWEPGYTAVEKFRVEETGTLPFGYHMTVSMQEAANAEDQALDDAVTQAISVWCYTGEDTVTLPGSFQLMQTNGEWEEIGTLYEIITQKLPLFRGEMDQAAVSGEANGRRTHMIALHMDERFTGEGVQGHLLENITITLIATQIAGQNDAFGPGYNAAPANIIATGTMDDVYGCVLSGAHTGSSVSVATAMIPADVDLEDDVTELTLRVQEVAQPKVSVAAGKNALALDISITGISEDNTAPITVTLNIARGLTSVDVYHEGVAMEHTYDSATGELVLTVTEFSQFDITYGTEYVSTEEELRNALISGDTVLLMEGITVDTPVIMNGGSLNGGGKIIDASLLNDSYDCAITTTGGTVKNITITGDPDGTRGIGSGSSGDQKTTGDLYIDNVTIDSVQYAINGWGEADCKVVVTNSTINGWCSYSGIASLEFTNCAIGKGSSWLGYHVIYGNTLYADCSFEKGFAMCAADTLAEGSEVIFTNCTYGNEMVTAANFLSLFCYEGDEVDFSKLRNCDIIIDGVKVVWPKD